MVGLISDFAKMILVFKTLILKTVFKL